MKITSFDPRLAIRGALRTAAVGGWLRVDRPTTDDGGLSADAPGAAIDLLTDSATLTVHLRRNGRHLRRDAVNGTLVLTSGNAELGTGTLPADGPEDFDWTVGALPGAGGMRLLRFHFPYGESVDFGGFTLAAGARLETPPPPTRRPRWLACGDSITQGFRASSPLCNYPALVGARRNWEVLNAGLGARCAEAVDGAILARVEAELVTVLLGYNDYHQERSPARMRVELAAMLRALRRQGARQRPVVAITPLWSSEDAPRGLGLGLDAYRQATIQAVADVADPLVQLLDGLTLLPARPHWFTDGIHPNDAGFRLLADNLARVLPEPRASL